MALQSKEQDEEDSDNEYAGMPALINKHYVSDSDSSDDEIENEAQDEHFMDYNGMDEEEIIPEETVTPKYNPKVARAMRNLQSSFNPEAGRVLAAQ